MFVVASNTELAIYCNKKCYLDCHIQIAAVKFVFKINLTNLKKEPNIFHFLLQNTVLFEPPY